MKLIRTSLFLDLHTQYPKTTTMQYTTMISLVIVAVAGHAAAHSGDLTWYGAGGGTGACGKAIHDTDHVVSVNAGYFKAANPNLDPICGKTVTIKYKGKSATAQVLDKCSGCNAESIDVTPSVFSQLADLGAGRIHVDWTGI